jgi:uncharacterized repeat protein (TIGR01451 family)
MAVSRGAYKLISRARHSLAVLLVLLPAVVHATPIALQQSFAGNLDFVVTGGTLRTQSNSGNACAISGGAVSATLSGIPAGATIRAAYLYWGGSGTTVDDVVSFDGATTFADRTFTENFNSAGYDLWYFGGSTDITSAVATKRNGSYSFGGLTVTTTDQGGSAPYCSSQAVVAGWGMIVIFEDPAEDFRVVNLYDGLQWFRGNQIALTPSNFQIPASPVNGKLVVLSWEGDVENSAPLGGFNENITVNSNALTDGLNPLNNQFNNTVNTLGSNTAWGVDLDIYNIDSLVSPGDTSLTTVYSSGGDLVLLTMQAVSVSNSPTSDLRMQKRVASPLQDAGNAQYRLTVSNNGPIAEPGPIQVSDTLDGRLTYAGFAGSGWSCSTAGQTVTCTHPGPLASGASLAPLLLNVTVAPGSGGQTISNSATVSGQNFDNIAANNTDTINSYVYGPVTGIKNLYTYFASAPSPFTDTLSRIVPTSNSQVTDIAKNGGTAELVLAPALVRPLTLRAGTIPVRLCSRRYGTGSGGSNTLRSMSVTLAYSGPVTGTIGTSATQAFTSTAWISRVFNVALPANLTLPAGTQLRLIVTNESSGGGTRLVGASSSNCGAVDVSRVELDALTVINIEDLQVFDAPWPGGNPISSVVDNGADIHVRALISDPFGSFDINSATLDVFDESDTLYAGSLAMTLVDDDVANGERTYEYTGTVPPWPGSPYVMRVRADEGTEGTVSSLAATALQVTPQPPLLMVTKLASSPSANPGSTISYSIQVSNAGTGDAAAVEITDALPAFLSFATDTFGPGQPLEFVDGTPSSGLTLSTPEYSNDNAATYTYTPVSGGGGAPPGFDANVTHFRVPFTGTMPPGGSFTLHYDARVD